MLRIRNSRLKRYRVKLILLLNFTEIQNPREGQLTIIKHLRSVVDLTSTIRAATEDARITTSR